MEQDVSSRAISFGTGSMEIPERLLLAHGRGEVLFVCGAGVSMPAGLPDFRRLVMRVYDRLDRAVYEVVRKIVRCPNCDWESVCEGLNDAQLAEARRFAEGDFDVVLGMLERRLDRTARADSSVRKAVDEILRLVEKPAAIHRALKRLADRGGTITVATTNFDRMLERAGRSLRPRPKTYSLAAIPRPTSGR